MKKFLIIIFIAFTANVFAQKESEFKSDRKRSFAQIKELKENGALVLRLTLHKKKADLYRKAGNHKVADKIEKDLREKNELLALTLLDPSFDFCKVYIIEASNYGRVINGEKSGYFLDKSLEIDSSIVMTEENIYFMEVGNVYEVVRKEGSFLKSEVSSTPIIQNALVIKDNNMMQLMKPFPFNVPLDGIFLDISNFVVYNKGRSANGLMFTDMESYNNYMRRKYNLSKKDIFTVQKIFNLNVRLFGFYSSAKKVEFDAITEE